MDPSDSQSQPTVDSHPAVTVLAPVFEDWESVIPLLDRLEGALSGAGLRGHVVLVDDGSIRRAGRALMKPGFSAIGSVKIIRLRANLGHQRAIAVGLSWLSENQCQWPTVIMDSDGEDAPEDVPKLVALFNEHQGQKAVFAARSKRSESLLFVLLYNCYKVIHLALTGKAVKVGNFSVIPPAALKRVVVLSELWNHYAATMFKSRFPIALLPTPRSTRIAGRSTMNLASLIIHGLSGLSVFSDLIGVRMLVASGLSLPVLGLLFVAGVALKVDGTVVGHVGMTLVLILLLADLVVLMTTVFFIFIILASRDAARMLPARDYRYFIDEVEQDA
jgi:polyisoprenyl-phosphate glycosyltransferase